MPTPTDNFSLNSNFLIKKYKIFFLFCESYNLDSEISYNFDNSTFAQLPYGFINILHLCRVTEEKFNVLLLIKFSGKSGIKHMIARKDKLILCLSSARNFFKFCKNLKNYISVVLCAFKEIL